MLCPKCNKENKNSNIKCVFCGNVLNKVEDETDTITLDKNELIKTENMFNGYLIFSGILSVLIGLCFVFLAFSNFKKYENGFIFAIVLVPIAISIMIYGASLILKAINKNKLVTKVKKGETVSLKEVERADSLFSKLYRFSYVAQMTIFTAIWFTFVIFMTYEIIKSKEYSVVALIIVPFWLFGFYLLYAVFRSFKKKK